MFELFIKWFQTKHDKYRVDLDDPGKCIIIRSEKDHLETFYELFISRTETGFFIKYKNSQKFHKTPVYGPNTLDLILQNKQTTFRKAQDVFKLWVPNKGIVCLTQNGRRCYLSPGTIPRFTNSLGAGCEELLLELIRFSMPASEWWYKMECVNGDPVYHFTGHFQYNMPVQLLRKSTNLQSYINKINPTEHPVSASWFQDCRLSTVFYMVLAGSCLHNPVELWMNYKKLSDREFSRDFMDTIAMSSETGIKFSFTDKSTFRNQHDRVLQQFLLNAPAQPIQVAEVYKQFSEMFPFYEIIEDGNKLSYEGKSMKHCVGTYVGAVNQGISGIYRIEFEDKRYTLELRRGDSKLHMSQMKGYANSDPPRQLIQKVTDDLTTFNEWVKVNTPHTNSSQVAQPDYDWVF